MKAIKYSKLVRDKIPEIIERDGKKVIYEILEINAYLESLDKKLLEEIQEYIEIGDLEELADIIEVIYAIVEAKGHEVTELENIRIEKTKKRGGFRNKVFLKEVVEE